MPKKGRDERWKSIHRKNTQRNFEDTGLGILSSSEIESMAAESLREIIEQKAAGLMENWVPDESLRHFEGEEDQGTDEDPVLDENRRGTREQEAKDLEWLANFYIARQRRAFDKPTKHLINTIKYGPERAKRMLSPPKQYPVPLSREQSRRLKEWRHGGRTRSPLSLTSYSDESSPPREPTDFPIERNKVQEKLLSKAKYSTDRKTPTGNRKKTDMSERKPRRQSTPWNSAPEGDGDTDMSANEEYAENDQHKKPISDPPRANLGNRKAARVLSDKGSKRKKDLPSQLKNRFDKDTRSSGEGQHLAGLGRTLNDVQKKNEERTADWCKKNTELLKSNTKSRGSFVSTMSSIFGKIKDGLANAVKNVRHRRIGSAARTENRRSSFGMNSGPVEVATETIPVSEVGQNTDITGVEAEPGASDDRPDSRNTRARPLVLLQKKPKRKQRQPSKSGEDGDFENGTKPELDSTKKPVSRKRYDVSYSEIRARRRNFELSRQPSSSQILQNTKNRSTEKIMKPPEIPVRSQRVQESYLSKHHRRKQHGGRSLKPVQIQIQVPVAVTLTSEPIQPAEEEATEVGEDVYLQYLAQQRQQQQSDRQNAADDNEHHDKPQNKPHKLN